MGNLLRIGISACFFHADPKRAIFKGKSLLYLEESIGRWLMSEPGVVGYLIPADAKGGPYLLAEVVRDLDGLLLQGGSDVAPESYGEKPLKPEWGGDRIRDTYEITLLKAFVASGKPVLGVCRGAQLMNVAYGGTLYQDIGTQLPQAAVHRDWEIYDQNHHALKIEAGSKLSATLGGLREAKVNTVHHQAIKDLGKGLVVEARSPDGVIEAIRHEGSPYVAAVQWHPEFHTEEDIRSRGLLDGRPILREFLDEALKSKRKQSHA